VGRRRILLPVGIVLLLAAVAGGIYWYTRTRPVSLTLRTVPSGVTVEIDGNLQGTTSDTGLVVLIGEFGPHHLRLEKKGYTPDTSTVVLYPGEAVDLDVVMQVPGMRFVRGGAFQMGDPEGDYSERPARTVTVRPFYLDRTEVTAEAFGQYLPAYRPPSGGSGLPASGVSWDQAGDYCAHLGKRLPTEAEWERACKGVRGAPYSYGDDYDPALGRTGARLKAGPVAVGSFPPGNAGLLDMTGNVWEWCSDWYDRDTYRAGSTEDPRGPASGTQHALRGGAWYSNARYARCAHRPGEVKMAWHNSFGFRCARDLN
jgi:sulfatase modifying factor 1